MKRRLTLGGSLECKDLTNRLSLFVYHTDVIGGVGLQVRDGRAVIVAARMLNGIHRQGAKVVGICAILQNQVLTSF